MSLPAPLRPDKITDQQMKFVEKLVTNGGQLEQAAIDAGYSKHSARRQAYALLDKSHVMEAYMRTLANELKASAGGAAKTITSLATGARSEYVKLQAAQDLLDRIGMKAPDKVQHSVSGDVNISIDLG